MNLNDGVLSVRDRLGEYVPYKWSDQLIIADLNESAKRMCSTAQSLMEYATPPLAMNYQETYIPEQADQIYSVAYYSGQLFQLAPINQMAVQFGGFSGGIPIYFYTRTGTTTYTPQVTGGAIVATPIPTTQAVTIIGTWPIVAQQGTLNVWYTRFHPQMLQPKDPCFIPESFKDAWTAYAISRGKEKESAYEEAQYFRALYDKGVEEYRVWSIMQRQTVEPPQIGGNVPPIWGRPSSTVIIVANNPGLINP